MKKTTKELACILSCLIAPLAFGQNTLQFTGASATQEGAILLNWASNSNEVYEVDYADSLIDTNTGTITWNTLYTDYPSHGTNTFIADAGNFDVDPPIPHPKDSPMRFYRVVLTGTNTSPSNPTVSIVSPTNGETLSGDVTISAAADSTEYLTEVLLYVDGEPQWITAGTNFSINTCEWPNGPHTLFVTAKAMSSMEAPSYNGSVTIGRAVSSYVVVNFSNLVTRLDLSQNFFEPSEGQTQHVSAVFAADSDWTLQIQDINSNTVRTVTGSGSTMDFDWDGTGDGGASIDDGAYTYLVTAQTNGMDGSEVGDTNGSGSTDTNPPPSPFAATSSSPQTSELYAMPSDGSGSPVPLKLYPLGVETNNLTIFYGTSDLMTESLASTANTMESGAAAGAYSGPAAQTTRFPKRKPRVGVKNKAGTFGICYKTYPNGFAFQEPPTGNPYPPLYFTGLDGGARSSGYVPWSSLLTTKSEAWGFAQVMQQVGGYKQKFNLADEQWSPNDIKSLAKGGNSIFKDCNFGFLSTHGCYGTYPEIDGIYYTYLALFDDVNHGSYLKLSDMAFGSATAKWMTIFSCNMLNGNAVTSMANNSLLPMNGNLHLLLGFNSYSYTEPYLGFNYASNLVTKVTIHDSFINACRESYSSAYQNTNNIAIMTYPVVCRVMGYNSCFGDTLYLYNDPDPNSGMNFEDTTVFTPTP